MSTQQACSAYIPGPYLCRNGFTQNNACTSAICHCCGKHTDTVAACVKEEVPVRFLDDAGRPKYVKEGEL